MDPDEQAMLDAQRAAAAVYEQAQQFPQQFASQMPQMPMGMPDMSGYANQAMSTGQGAYGYGADVGQDAMQSAQQGIAQAGAWAGQGMQAAQQVYGQAAGYASQGMQDMQPAMDHAGMYANQALAAGQAGYAHAGAYAGQALQGAQAGYSQAGQFAGVYGAQMAQGAQEGFAEAGAYAGQAAQGMQPVLDQAGQYAGQAGQVTVHVAGQVAQGVQPVLAHAGSVAGDAMGDASEAARAASTTIAAAMPAFDTSSLQQAGGAVQAHISVAAGKGAAWGGQVYAFAADGLAGAKDLTSDVAGVALSEMRKVAGQAPQYTAMALAAASRGANVAKTVGQDTAQVAGAMTQEAGAWLADHKDEAAAFAASGYSFMHAGVQAGAAMVPWGSINKAYALSRVELAAAVGAMTGVAASLIDWVKLEVVRDYFQIVSLFLGGIASSAMSYAKLVWGNVSNIISFDIHFVVPTVPPGTIYAILAAFGVLAAILLAIFTSVALGATADEVREGHEARTWEKQAAERAKFVMFLKYTLLLLVSAYLPVSRAAVGVLACDPDTAESIKGLGADIPCSPLNITGVDGKALQSCTCSDWKGYGGMAAAAVVILITYTVGFPIYCYFLIEKNKPVGSREDATKRFNADGELIPYSDAMYMADLRNDPRQQSNPFLVLYDGFERRWSFYKVGVMVMKLALVIPVMALYKDSLAQSGASLVILALFFFFTTYSRPFISKVSDAMDVSARVASLLTVIFGLLATPRILPNQGAVFGALINIVNAINAVVMLIGALWGVEFVRNRIKGWAGIIEFRNTSTHRQGSARDTIIGGSKDNNVDMVVAGGWDVRLEAKHRVWHTFWRTMMVNGLKEQAPEVGKRLIQLERVAADVGKKRISDHYQALTYPGRGALRAWIAAELEGVDVFWDGQVQDGKLDSATCFGKMYTMPYPFHAVMVYDDSDDLAFLYEADLDGLVSRNTDPEIQRRRGVRKSLRALEGQMVKCPFSQMETHRVEDGTEHYRDNEGKQKSRTRYSNVQVLMHYTNGKLGIGRAKSGQMMSAGFHVSLSYDDGHGVAIAPHTGKHHNVHGSCTKSGADLDITHEYAVVGKLAVILGDPANAGKITTALPGLLAGERDYRAGLAKERAAAEATLSSAFWLHVFDAEGLPRPALEWFLRNIEQHPAVRAIPEAHATGLDFLYARMSYVRSHPAVALWYVFWDDVWTENGTSLPQALSNKVVRDVLDPTSPVAIAYTPMSRQQLEGKLAGLGLRGKYRFFTDGLLDILYAQINRMEAEFKGQLQAIADGAPVPMLEETSSAVATAAAVLAANRPKKGAKSSVSGTLATSRGPLSSVAPAPAPQGNGMATADNILGNPLPAASQRYISSV